MKTSYLKIIALVAIVAFFSCKNDAKEAETTSAEDAAVAESTAITYKTNTANSTIEWKGSKPLGSHNGVIAISEGSVMVNDGVIESGNFIIDMNTITVVDIPAEDEGNAKLKGHLTSADFFDIEKYPTAKFEVTGVSTAEGKTMLSGNLTLKDATNNISFPVETSMSEDGSSMKLKSETFTIDRTKWNVKYGSKSLFDNLGDKFINDDIELKITLVTNKA
ncbi:MAG: hypothetical protein Wins2KO_29580 [Winogradskyella sp.]